MKKILFLAIAIVAFATTALAQDEYKKFRFGVKADMNLSDMNYAADHSSKIGFAVGALVEYNFTDSWSLNSGLEYSWKGTELLSMPFTMGYLQIPIRAGYRYDFSDKFGLFVEAGPYLAVAIHGDVDGDDVFEIDGMKRFDLGISTNVGVQVVKHVKIGLGYDYGFIGVNSADPAPKNSNFHVGVAYMF